MKKGIYLFLILLLSCSSSSDGIENTVKVPKSKSVLFVGNSFTFYNSMPSMIQQMASSVDDELIFDMHAPGGTKIETHANSEELVIKINSKKWDYVTIQTQSAESALSQEHFDSNVFPHVEILINKIKANSSETTPLFFMTWGYENGEYPWFCVGLPYLCEFEGMNDKLTERYTFMAQTTNSVLSPVGIVWKNLRTSHPEISLYRSDESHPSEIGSYLAACTFYTIIFENDPTFLTYDNENIDDTIEAIIKNEVKKTVYNNLSNWYFN